MKNSFYTSFGIWMIIIPFLGVPILWRSYLTIFSGIFLVLVSLGPIIIKKIDANARIRRPRIKKTEIRSETFSQNTNNETQNEGSL